MYTYKVVGNMKIEEKLEILSSYAKYDISCVYNHSKASSHPKNFIYYSQSSTGRTIPLLKVLFSNACIYDCAYCINRKTNNIPRATFTVDELVNITINFYKRNYIKGLFLSSAIIKSPDFTMEQMLKVVKKLRIEEDFKGYIHLKIIPGASEFLVKEAGFYADRVSINVELPTKHSLLLLAPDKKPETIQNPLIVSSKTYSETINEAKKYKGVKIYSPAGQTTQIIVGATPEYDKNILYFADKLYKQYKLKRVYYSAYSAINIDKRLPLKSEEKIREKRLYQADFLIREYNFTLNELFEKSKNLNLTIDPKTSWAINHPEFFPIDINKATFDELIRVPGIGIKSAKLIIKARKYSLLNLDTLRKLGINLKNARYFITYNGKKFDKDKELTPLFLFDYTKDGDVVESSSI